MLKLFGLEQFGQVQVSSLLPRSGNPETGLVQPLVAIITSYALRLAGSGANCTRKFRSPWARIWLYATHKKKISYMKRTFCFYIDALLHVLILFLCSGEKWSF